LKSNNMKRQELLKRSNKALYAKWENAIQDFVATKRSQGVDIEAQIENGQSNEYWLLFELNQDKKFLKDVERV